jgi:beta-lactamase regulating signal transducer with metallopeptidase domain
MGQTTFRATPARPACRVEMTSQPVNERAEEAAGRRWDRRVWLLVGLALLLRVPGLNRPLLGNFATKNVAYAMIAQNWATGQASLWHPTLHVLREGGPGLHLLEVPVTAYVAGALWRVARFLGACRFGGVRRGRGGTLIRLCPPPA